MEKTGTKIGSYINTAIKIFCHCVVVQSNQLIVVDESNELVAGVVTQSDVLQYLIGLKS